MEKDLKELQIAVQELMKAIEENLEDWGMVNTQYVACELDRLKILIKK